MKIAVAGDWHGNTAHAVAMIQIAKDAGCEKILHVGDFGYHFAPHFLNKMKRALGDTELWFIDGNHENFYKLYTYPINEDGRRELRPNIFHLPRGFRWKWNDTTFLAMGGAVSVDKKWRTPFAEWWPQEEITIKDAFKIYEAEDVHADVMVCHDVPADFDIPGIEGNPMGFPEDVLVEANRHRKLLQAITDEVKPNQIFCGHYHRRHTGFLHGQDYDATVDILDCDGTPSSHNMMTYEV